MDSLTPEFQSISLADNNDLNNHTEPENKNGYKDTLLKPFADTDEISFKLLDVQEKLQIKNEEDFLSKLGCSEENVQVKVVAIFGNTGDGKSHFLNRVFFDGRPVFKTCKSQTSCTMGVWAAYCRKHQVLVLDTEGMFGINAAQNQRQRMLLKVLAISDIIVYRTRSEKLRTDMFSFLAGASKSYLQYFKDDLEVVSVKAKSATLLSPALFIIHDTRDTEVLATENGVSPEAQLRELFAKQGYSIEGFSSLHYVGESWQHKTNGEPNLEEMTVRMFDEIRNNTVRTPRSLGVILEMIQVINNRFNGKITENNTTFPDEYFTCTEVCRCCGERCINFMNHDTKSKGSDHKTSKSCISKSKYDNKIYLCLSCDKEGRRTVVYPQISNQSGGLLGFATYVWSGYVLDCEHCGEIYKSRQYWMGNEEPDQSCVKIEYTHVWKENYGGTSPNAGQHLLDGVTAIGNVLSNISAPPAKALSSWITNQVVNPSYWKDNSLCINCDLCQTKLINIHHCRKCGQGFCENCSSNKALVPERGWKDSLVRVCDPCFNSKLEYDIEEPDNNVAVRQVAEVLHGTLSSVGKLPLDVFKDTVRPKYWRPDEEITECISCKLEFGSKLTLHHCRKCGEGVCDDCSMMRMPVRELGWHEDVRVCDPCYSKHWKEH